MPADEKRRERELAELAALADGSLPPARRREVEARVAASPRLQALLREQQAVRAAIRARDERAPERLRESIEEGRAARRPALRPRLAVGMAALAVTVGALALLALPGSDGAPPSLDEAAALASRPPTSAEPSGPVLAGVEAWGVEYPDLGPEHGWRPAGSRRDRLGDRGARTVFYSKDGHRMAYTILSTGQVRVPDGARSWRREGRLWHAFEEDGRTVVAWERRGHMCVVSASGVSGRSLVKLLTS